jgi:hypothetical protein
MSGLKGTAFNELFFALRNYVQRPIDEFGTDLAYVKTNNINNLADFEFTIEKVNNEYVLVSKKGTTSKENKTIVNRNSITVE